MAGRRGCTSWSSRPKTVDPRLLELDGATLRGELARDDRDLEEAIDG